MQHSVEFSALCEDAKSRIKEISVAEVDQFLAAGKIDHLIDVREADEFNNEHIPKARHISKGWIEAKIHHVAKNKDDVIVLYCGGGNRSALAADNLQKMGYTNVLSMRGGFREWKTASTCQK